jgi:hypothetical protein
MATTDTKPGFRLPWSTNGADAEANGSEPAEAAQATETDAVAEPVTDGPATEATADAEAPEMTAETDAPPEAVAEVVGDPEPEPATTPEPAPETEVAATPATKASAKKPSKFLADLTRAMQATAESSRNETMERFTAEAKAATERVHAAAAEEATELRRVCDDDVSGIRDWSKAEIARIREETENRISGRKSDLERELEAHAGTVETRIERVTARVAAFEAEVAEFYERLFAEEDPTRFAELAEQLPEPPSLEIGELDAPVMTAVTAKTEPIEAPAEEIVVEAVVEAPVAETVEVDTVEAEVVTDASGEAAEAEVAAEAPEATAAPEVSAETGTDPRIAMLELTPDFEAAEAEAAMSAAEAPADTPDEIPTIADEVLAARLAGLVPEENSESNPIQTTKVVVTGLVSVASIAGFKRHLGRLQGVTTVGVSSGPDGEFVFSVHHLPTVDLAAGIQGLPGFESKITSQGEGAIEVAARDPEAHD